MVHDLALEPQPHPGALPGAAAGPAGRAVTAPHSATAALSHTSNTAGLAAAEIADPIPARDWRHEAKRPRRMGLCSEVADDGENPEDHPALARSYVRGRAFVSACRLPGKFLSAALNLFSIRPDKIIAWDIASLGE